MDNNSVNQSIQINTAPSKVWDVITNPQYSKTLGNEFDKNAFMASDWKKGSEVHFVYEPDKIAATGKISELIEEKKITVSYDFHGFLYSEEFKIDKNNSGVTLSLSAGPYGEDFEAQKVVWSNWLRKVKELSEK